MPRIQMARQEVDSFLIDFDRTPKSLQRSIIARFCYDRTVLLMAAERMRNVAKNILANDDPDGADGRAASTLLAALEEVGGD